MAAFETTVFKFSANCAYLCLKLFPHGSSADGSAADESAPSGSSVGGSSAGGSSVGGSAVFVAFERPFFNLLQFLDAIDGIPTQLQIPLEIPQNLALEYEKSQSQLKWDESNCSVAEEADAVPNSDGSGGGDDWESITELPPEWRMENLPSSSSNPSLMNHLISGAQHSVASFLKTMGGSVRM